jgi:hypothetical protein
MERGPLRRCQNWCDARRSIRPSLGASETTPGRRAWTFEPSSTTPAASQRSTIGNASSAMCGKAKASSSASTGPRPAPLKSASSTSFQTRLRRQPVPVFRGILIAHCVGPEGTRQRGRHQDAAATAVLQPTSRRGGVRRCDLAFSRCSRRAFSRPLGKASEPSLYFDTDHLSRAGLTEFFPRDLKPVLVAAAVAEPIASRVPLDVQCAGTDDNVWAARDQPQGSASAYPGQLLVAVGTGSIDRSHTTSQLEDYNCFVLGSLKCSTAIIRCRVCPAQRCAYCQTPRSCVRSGGTAMRAPASVPSPR